MNTVLLCRMAILSGLVSLCLGCSTGLGQTGRDGWLKQGSAQVAPSAPDGGAKYDRPTLDRMDRTTVKKAVAQQRQGSASSVRQTAGTSSDGSVVQSISSTFKQGIDKVGSMVAPAAPPKEEKDPISLSTKAAPSPELHVALARLCERQGKLEEADQQYQQALKLEEDSLQALAGLGRLRDRQGRLDEAIVFYQKAIKAHGGEATVFNDLGLCYARKRMHPESAQAFQRAVQLQPTRPLYRNNYAAVLVEVGDNDAAFAQLLAAHGEAGACYNLGYLLYKKGQYDLAARLFAKALERDPSMVQAERWLEQAQRALASRPGSGQSPLMAGSIQPQTPRLAQPRGIRSSQPAGFAESSDAFTSNAPPLLQARRTVVPDPYPRQLPPVRSQTQSGQADIAPLPPTLSAERAAPQQGTSGATGSTVSPIAPLPSVTP